MDLDELDAAYQRVADKVRDELLAMYKTKCPLTGKDADIIYGFWVKQGICVDPACKGVTDLFKNYEVARKRGDATISYLPDVACPHCKKKFDWELDRCTITAGGPQVLGEKPEGKGRKPGTPFVFGRAGVGVSCPHCGKQVGTDVIEGVKPKDKKVKLHVLVDPSTGDFFEVRGDIPSEVEAPRSRYRFRPEGGPVLGGKFTCARCGRAQDIVESARTHGSALPFRYYGFYAHTPHASEDQIKAREIGLPTNNGKWFGAPSRADLVRIDEAQDTLRRCAEVLPLPHQEIHDGYNTNRLVIHQFRHWSDLYSPRQLLALSKLLKAISEETDATLRDSLLGAFQSTLNYQSNLCRYNILRNQIEGVQAAHDYRNPTTIAENPALGASSGMGRGTFVNYVDTLREGLTYINKPDVLSRALESVSVNDVLGQDWKPSLHQASATDVSFVPPKSQDLIITDPPYAGSVQYAEMSDWSYVWLHQVLKNHYPEQFGSEVTLKSQEIIEDGAHKDAAFFFEHLTAAWRECHRVLKDDGLLVFTFHHREGDRWSGLLRSLFDAGFYLVAAYPTHSEALNSIVIQATKGITYDIVHVCRKRPDEPQPIPWSRLRREVQREAREQLKELERDKDLLPGPDVQMILLGKALRLFSQHYGKVLGPDNELIQLDDAMERILMLVREVRGQDLPLPGNLRDVDNLTQIALLHLVGKGPWLRDDLHKELRGYAHGLQALLDAGLIRATAGDKGRLEVVPPAERVAAKSASDRPDGPLIDKVHLLTTTVADGKSVTPLLKRWSGRWAEIIAALGWMAKTDSLARDLLELTLRQVEAMGPDTPRPTAQQIPMFSSDDDPA